MEALQFQLTEQGVAAVLSGTGFQHSIAEISVGTSGYTPLQTQVSLANEVQRVSLSGGAKVSPTQMHVTALFDGDSEYAVKEAGAWLDNGVLFGVWSHPTQVLAVKTAAVPFLFAQDLDLSVLPADSVNLVVNGPNLSLYYAEHFSQLSTANISLMRQFLELKFELIKKGVL